MLPVSLFIVALLFNEAPYIESLTSGFTCHPTVTLSCSSGRKLVILDVIFASKCPNPEEDMNGTSIYAPSRCIGYQSESIRKQCQGEQSCTIDHSVEQRPSFSIGDQANCAFKSESINIEYSCVPDFYSSKLPRIDLCSLQQLDDLHEGFIHSPLYPQTYTQSLNCSKLVPAPPLDHRLKILAVDLDLKSSDWLEINSNGLRLRTSSDPFMLIYDDIIEASLDLKTSPKNSNSSPKKFLLYFIVTPIRRSRPSTTTLITTEKTETTVPLLAEGKSAARLMDTPSKNPGLILLVVLLSGSLFVTLCGFLLYKRRNDRRVRYLIDTFNSFFPARSSTKPISPNDLKQVESLKKSHSSEHIYSADPLEEIVYETIPTDPSSSTESYTQMHATLKP